MRRSYLLYLEDMLESSNNILSYAGNITFEELIKDKMRVDAIVRNFEIIGMGIRQNSSGDKRQVPFC